uniref:Uncharacterized protein n=1 Tax=Globodera rostochiensis TaxID=31243 RepID=A0A914HXD8_GLORO
MVRNLCLLLLTTHCLSGLIAVNAASDDELEKKEPANEEAHSSIDTEPKQEDQQKAASIDTEPKQEDQQKAASIDTESKQEDQQKAASIDTESKQEDQQKAAFPHPEVSTSTQKRQPKPLKSPNFEYNDAFPTSSSSAEGDNNSADEDYLATESEAESNGAESLVKSSSSSGEDSDEWFMNNVAPTKSKARKSSLALGPSKGPNKSGKKPNQPRGKTMITLSSSSSDSDQQQKGKATIRSKKGLAHKASIQQQKQGGPKVILPKATSQRKDKSAATSRSPSAGEKASGKQSTNSAEIGNSSRKGKGQIKSLSDAEIDEFIEKLKLKHNSKVKKNKQSSSDEDNKSKKEMKRKRKHSSSDEDNKSKKEMKRKRKHSSSDEDNTSKDDTESSDNSLNFNSSDDSLNVSSPEEKETPKKGKRTTQPQNKKQSAKKVESKSDKAGGTKATPTQKRQKKLH